MSEPTRYDLVCDTMFPCDCNVVAEKDGAFVRYGEYAAERAVLDAARRWHDGLNGDPSDVAHKLDVLKSRITALRALEGGA